MYKKLLFATVATVFAVTASSARDITECSVGEDEIGYMVGDECWSLDEIRANKGADCWRVFNTGSRSWNGVFYSDMENHCYITVPEGYDFTTDFFFDEDRFSESFYECSGGGVYCPIHGILSYNEVQRIMGNTSMSETCPSVDDVYLDRDLTQPVRAGRGISTPVGATSVDDCYIEPGAYYDATGQFEITNNCAY